MNNTSPGAGSWGMPYSNTMNILATQREYLQNQLQAIDAQMQQYPAQPQPARNYVSTLTGKVVGSIEEVQNLPCPADGSGAYYPCPTGKKIYVKQISDNGTIEITVYEPVSKNKNVNATNTSLEDTLKSIDNRLASLDSKLVGATEPTISNVEENKGEMTNEQHE